MAVLTDLTSKYPDFQTFAAAKEALMNNDLVHACEVLFNLLDSFYNHGDPRPLYAPIQQALRPVLDALDCNT